MSTCRVPDPLSTAAAPADKLVIRRAVSAREARNQVALSAVEWMAGRVLRGRELLGPADLLAAGWSRAEALYRARAAAAFRAIPAEIDWRPTSDGVLTADPVRDYLTRTLLSGGHAVREVATARQQDGFVRARLRIVDGLEAHGIGLDPGHAVRDLLLRAVAGIGAERAEVCLPAPPVDTWGEALARLDDVSPGPPWQEDSSWLPFLDSQAYVVRLPGAPEW